MKHWSLLLLYFHASLQRVRLIVAAKNIPAEEINVHLQVKPEWFLEKINPYGKVPVVEHEGKVIRESLIAFGKYLPNNFDLVRVAVLPKPIIYLNLIIFH